MGVEYFNYMESFVGNSGLFGVYVNGKWVIGFVESCYGVFGVILVYVDFFNSYFFFFKGVFLFVNLKVYVNM